MTSKTDVPAPNEQTGPEPKASLKDRIIEELKFLIGLFAFITVFFTLVWGHYKIPSESMQPTLEVGDHLYVSKFAYGYSKYSLPFGLSKLPVPSGKIFSRTPKRGDVVVFSHPRTDMIMIKRVIGLPGDTINIKAGRLELNGAIIERETVSNYLYRQHTGSVVGVDVYNEILPGQKDSHVIYEQSDSYALDDVGPFTVPEGHVFMMGDNRDNSVDSRAPSGPGMVPLERLIGRADLMMFSFKKCDKSEGLYCPPRRWALGL
ncbi:signal peptidase I [Fretibacter rubidus]|uniref:signal peptidase I n=1 Tax=Fretibacter rubidus TaxID=570162 RepID=UPI00352A41BC